MKRHISKSIFIFFSLLSCSDPVEKKEELPDFSIYTSLFNPSLWGQLGKEYIRWTYGTEFQKGAGAFMIYENCDETGQFSPILYFQLTNDSQTKKMILYSPAMDFNDPDWMNKQFEINSKWQTGNYLDGYKVIVRNNGKDYETNELTQGEVQVLKTLEFVDPFGAPSLRVWLGIHTELSSCGCNCLEKPVQLTDAVLVVDYPLNF